MIDAALLDDLKACNPVEDLAGRFVTLRRSGSNLVGPCPLCGGSKRSSRFEVKIAAQSWVCAACGDGGDVIKLVQKLDGVDFLAAVERLGGVSAVDGAAALKRQAARAEGRREMERRQAQFRAAEIARLADLWRQASPIDGRVGESYLRLRGLPVRDLLPHLTHLRCLDAVPYFHGQTLINGRQRARQIHVGPALLGWIRGPDGRFAGLHMTWINLDTPKGKAILIDPDTGEVLRAKKMRGTSKAGSIDLIARDEPRALVMGEGIETTLKVYAGLAALGKPIGRTAFRAGLDLGNIGGSAIASVAHPTGTTDKGRVLKVPGPDPDMAAPGIPIPDSVRQILLLGDGDSDPFTTDMALRRAAKRYSAPGRLIKIAWAPAGKDFDDLLRFDG